MQTSKGMTILEVLLALAIMSIVLAGAGGLFTLGLAIWNKESRYDELTQVARVLLTRISTDVYHSQQVRPVAAGQRWLWLQSQHYLNNDDTVESIMYTMGINVAANQRIGLYRRDFPPNQPWLEMSKDVKEVQFIPLDLNRDGTFESVRINLTVGTPVPGNFLAWEPETLTLSTVAHIRNGSP